MLSTQHKSVGKPCTMVACLSPGRINRAIVTKNGANAPSVHRFSSIRRQAVAVQQSVDLAQDPVIIPPTYPWFSHSGQAASSAFKEPLTGRPEPMGAVWDPETEGVNFAVFSSSATGVSLCLFTEDDLARGTVTYEIPLHPDANRTGDVWHVMLPKVDTNLLYGYRVYGSHQDEDPERLAGHRFDATKVVIDPYGKAVMSRNVYGQLGPPIEYKTPGVLGLAPTWPQPACTLPSPEDYFDWEGDKPLRLSMEELVIYEAHVRGFTADSSSNVQAPGTYQGFIEKLDYLQELGVNAVEFLPVYEFNELEYYTPIPGTDSYRVNFWGYSTVNYFAPMARYSHAVANGRGGRGLVNEFKRLVKECHRRGIEVILDVVFNHTAEGNHMGPTLSFRGLDQRVYYMMAPGGQDYNYSGCGNVFNANHPVVRQFIVDCLRYWVTEFHVDGFRFDLASILTRAPSAWHPESLGPDGDRVPLHAGSGAIVNEAGVMTDGSGVTTGKPLADPPLIQVISEDPVLRHTKMIAEAWDCDGLNQVGAFPHYGGRWAEWNGKYRDSVRQFIKGTDGPWAGDFASRLCGSPSIFAPNHPPGEDDWWGRNEGSRWRGGRGPTASINFVTAHDGFTLYDLVAYNAKRNEANGENNNDGETHNLSWNCGAEGPTDRADVLRLRQRQMRNFSCALLLSHGVPMFHMGDEYGHTKGGNNNTYCHDAPLNFIDWDRVAKDETGMRRFTSNLIKFRRSRPELCRSTYVSGGDIRWHGVEPEKPDWSETSRLVAYTLNDGKGGGLYVAFNTSHLPRVLGLPQWPGRLWQPVVDTGKMAPFDFLVADDQLSEEQIADARVASVGYIVNHTYPVLPWSCIVLQSVPESSIPQAKTAAAPAVKPAPKRPQTQAPLPPPAPKRPEYIAFPPGTTSTPPAHTPKTSTTTSSAATAAAATVASNMVTINAIEQQLETESTQIRVLEVKEAELRRARENEEQRRKLRELMEENERLRREFNLRRKQQ